MQNIIAHLQMTSWDDYRFAAAVARNGSLSGAARELGTHHSTVFRRLAALEDATGVRLFERTAEGYVPTAAGGEIFAVLGDVESGILAVERRLAGADLRLSGTVRVTTPEDIALLLVEPHLARFQAAYPDIELEIVTENRLFNLTRREADIAIRPAREPQGDMVGRRVADIAMAAYAAPAYLVRAGRPREPDDLRRHRLVGYEDSLAHVGAAQWLARFEDGANVALRSNSLMVQAAAVGAGLGVGVLPCFMVPAEGYEQLWPPLAALSGALWVLTHPDLRRTPRIRAVLDFFYEALAADRAAPLPAD
jgi:DNA-binding transcriptional LysR family regulator